MTYRIIIEPGLEKRYVPNGTELRIRRSDQMT